MKMKKKKTFFLKITFNEQSVIFFLYHKLLVYFTQNTHRIYRVQNKKSYKNLDIQLQHSCKEISLLGILRFP